MSTVPRGVSSWMRPSWWRRRSAMSAPAITLMRPIIADGLVVRHVLVRHHHAVLPEADAQAVAARLEVDVADAAGQRVVEHALDEGHGAAARRCGGATVAAAASSRLGPGDRRDRRSGARRRPRSGRRRSACGPRPRCWRFVGSANTTSTRSPSRRTGRKRVRLVGGHRRALQQQPSNATVSACTAVRFEQVGQQRRPRSRSLTKWLSTRISPIGVLRVLTLHAPAPSLQLVRLEAAQFDQHVADRRLDRARAQHVADLLLGHELAARCSTDDSVRGWSRPSVDARGAGPGCVGATSVPGGDAAAPAMLARRRSARGTGGRVTEQNWACRWSTVSRVCAAGRPRIGPQRQSLNLEPFWRVQSCGVIDRGRRSGSGGSCWYSVVTRIRGVPAPRVIRSDVDDTGSTSVSSGSSKRTRLKR